MEAPRSTDHDQWQARPEAAAPRSPKRQAPSVKLQALIWPHL